MPLYNSTFRLLALSGLQSRWTKTHSFFKESLAEHLLQTTHIGYCLSEIENQFNNGQYDSYKIAVHCSMHDVGETLSEDVNGLFKKIDPEFKSLVKDTESKANSILLKTLPSELRASFAPLLDQKGHLSREELDLIKISDLFSALFKIKIELLAGNIMYKRSYENTLEEIDSYSSEYKCVNYFMEMFAPAFEAHIEDLVEENLSQL